MIDDYKSSKERFVSDGQGSTILHINLVSTVSVASIIFFNILTARFYLPIALQFPLQFATLILPILLSVTLSADNPLVLTTFILLLAAGLVIFVHPLEKWNPAQALPARAPRSTITDQADTSKYIPPLAAVTTYKSHLMVLTVLSILAVDFTVFPRSLGKTETFGVSLMDLGVGSFVFAQGLTSSLPILKNPSYLASPLLRKLNSTTRKTLPLILLGLVRVVLVKGTDYPEHISEYGTHWNFFLTLAILPPLQALLHPLMLTVPVPIIALIVTLLHQALLSLTPLQIWTLEAARSTIISHNKEGITSIPGYLAIHLFGLATGSLILPTSPSEFRRQRQAITKQRKGDSDMTDAAEAKPRQVIKTAIELSSYVFVWWTLFAISALMIGRPPLYVAESTPKTLGGSVSRRLANTPYVLWTTAYNVLFLFCYLTLDIVFFPPPPSALPPGVSSPSSSATSLAMSSSLQPHTGIMSSRSSSPSPSRTSSQTELTAAVLPPSAIAPAPAAVPSTPVTPAAVARVNQQQAHARYDSLKLSLGTSPHGKRRSNESNREWEKAAEREIAARDISISDGPRRRMVTAGSVGKAPELLEAINANGLGVFLLANVLTGLVNLSIQTMYVPDPRALVILASYSGVVCGVAWKLRGVRLLRFGLRTTDRRA